MALKQFCFVFFLFKCEHEDFSTFRYLTLTHVVLDWVQYRADTFTCDHSENSKITFLFNLTLHCKCITAAFPLTPTHL